MQLAPRAVAQHDVGDDLILVTVEVVDRGIEQAAAARLLAGAPLGLERHRLRDLLGQHVHGRRGIQRAEPRRL